MSPLYKILLVAAQAATISLIAFPQAIPSLALAKPIGRSLPPRTMPVHHVKERSVRPLRSKNSKAKAVVPHNSHPSPANGSYHLQAYSYPGSHLPAGAYARSGDINVDPVVYNIDILNTYYTKAYNNAKTLKAYSSRASASKHKGAYKLQQNCASALTDFHTNSQGFTKTLGQMGAYKGHAHQEYDPLKELIKKLIGPLKEVLDVIDELFQCQPELRHTLGPIIYDIKCIIDELLNAMEKLTDDIITDCKPLIEKIDNEYGQAACKSGINLIGVCI